MTAPPYQSYKPAFPDTSFDPTNLGRSPTAPGPSVTDAHTIDFDASQAYFDGLQNPGSPLDHQPVTNDYPPYHSPYHSEYRSPQRLGHGHDTSPTSPRPAVPGLDPISKLGCTSNRASPQSHFGNNGVGHMQAPPQTYFPNQPFMYPQPSQRSQHSQHSQHPHSPTYAPQVGHAPQERRRSYTVQQRSDDAAQRTAGVELRNRLREEEKARRTLVIQRQVDDGMAALKLEEADAAHRTAEVERRNKQREQEKERRRLAIEKQVADGIKAIQLEKERERARAQDDRKACRKWLSDLAPASASVSTSASLSSAAADHVADTIDLYLAIGRQLRGFWQESRPAASSQEHRNEVIADVQQAINRKWPGQGLQVAAFGSSVTGLVTDSSDLDLVLLDPTRPYGVGTPPELRRDPHRFVRHSGGMPEWYSTNQVANAIRNSNKFRSIVPISGASVPIVKMIHKKHDIPADININERFGLFNSQLIQAYANLQPHIVRPLVFFLKHWFSRCDLNDPAGKRGSMTFSSYTIALMALQVLQIEGVLPNLQSPVLLNDLNVQPSFLYSRIKRPRRGKNGRATPAEDVSTPQKYNVTFATGDANMEPYKTTALEPTANGATTNGTSTASSASSTDRLLGRMLVAFIRFYTELDRRTQAVSVVNGTPLQRKKGSHPRHVLFDSASEDDASPQDPFETASRDADTRASLREEAKDIWAGEELVVQDPFIIDRNTSRNVKAAAIAVWQTTMQNAFTHLGLPKGAAADQARKVRLEDAPLILDLCLPSSLRPGTERTKATAGTNKISAAGQATEAQRLEEEKAAQARHLARQAARNLRREKRKQARSSKQNDARRLQEEAAMVEDMIDGIDSGQTIVSEVWRLRMGKVDTPEARTGDGSKNRDLSATPFTFSVTKTPAVPVPPIASASATANSEGSKQKSAGEAARPPTKTYGSTESEDIDLVALRMEQSARLSPT